MNFIKDVAILFIMCVTVTISAVVGMLIGEKIVRNALPTATLYGATLFGRMQVRFQQIKNTIRGWGQRISNYTTEGYEKTKRGVGRLIPFRQPMQAVSQA